MNYYEDEVATIYNANMETLLKDLKFDYILTDPPYNINYKYPDYDDNMNEKAYINLFANFQGHKTIIIHYPEAIVNFVCEGIGRVKKILSWCYNNNGSSKAHRSIAFFNCEPDLTKVKQAYKNPNDKRIKKLMEKQEANNLEVGCRMYDWFSDIQMIKNVSKEKCAEFTNQIPIKLLERILLTTTKEGDIILDPFFGSGSLYFACKNTNRKCIGIEQSLEHLKCFKIRLDSISQE
jgi:site-specific DNA-methyltransferase (adenine-specific)